MATLVAACDATFWLQNHRACGEMVFETRKARNDFTVSNFVMSEVRVGQTILK